MVLVDTELLRNRLGNFGAVAREHDGLLHACRMQVGDALRGIFLHHVGDDDVACIRAVKGNVEYGAGKLAIVVGNTLLAHELVVTHQHNMLVHHRTNAMAALLGNFRDAIAVDLARERLFDGKRDRMVGIRLCMGGDGKDELGVYLGGSLGVHRNHIERAVGKGARLVEYHRFRFRERFQVVAALHQDT